MESSAMSQKSVLFEAKKNTQKKKSRRYPNQGVLNFSSIKLNPEQKGIKHAKIGLALTVACHCSIKAVDHISDFIARHAKDEEDLANMQVYITKCSKIVRNVIDQALKEEYNKDILGKKF